MFRVVLSIALFISISIASLIIAHAYFGFTKNDILALISPVLVFNGALVVLQQMRVNLKFSQRKAAIDFILARVGWVERSETHHGIAYWN